MNMATGGMPYSKKDSKQRSNWQRSTSYSDRDDAHSLNSVPNDVRINNWDFSDWRPNSQSVDVKRRKKSKGNPEREREQSLSLDSPPHREGEKKQRTPSTFPRTKFTPSTPTQQRVALENLRQQLTFSDFDDQCSTDGEPNNERIMNTRKRHGSNYSHPESGSRGDGSRGQSGKSTDAAAAAGGHREVRSNRNNNRDDATTRDIGPDSNQIVGRLMQIRDYIKQANSMMDNLKKRGDPKSCKEDLEKLKTLIDNLKEQERGYMGLLQRTLAMRDESGLLENGAVARAEADGGNKRDSDDTASVDLDVDTDASETTENTQSSSSRPRIEDKLGADSEAEESGDSNTSHGDSDNMDNTVIPSLSGRRSDWGGVEESGQQMDEQQASLARQGELESLRRQEELLQILVEKQDQLQQLQDRQESLLSMKNKCEKKLAMAQAKERAITDPGAFVAAVSSAAHPEESEAKSNIVGYPESETEEEPSNDLLPKELLELRRHLTVLKNELKAEPSDSVDDAEPSMVAVGEQILEDKLRDLQDKKQRMDSLLRELQGLRSHRLDLLHESDMTEEASEQVAVPESLAGVPDIDLSTVSTQGAEQLREAQDKLGKLREVRERLNQLRDLVSYYQTVKGEGDVGAGGEGAEQSSATAYSDYGADMDPQAMLQQLLQQVGHERGDRGGRALTTDAAGVFGAGQTLVNLPPGPALEEHSDEENASDSESNKESQLSSLGPWGDDPEIQEKVQKLRAAKEKLRQLQDIVAMVQQSPSGAADIPTTVMELAASEEGEVISQVAQMNDHNMSVSEGEIPTQDKHSQREEARQLSTIEQQREELLGLREERERLMAVHSALQSLQEQFQLAENEEPDAKRQGKDGRGAGPSGSAPMVTFASNDELYSKMRKQRILREELRQKKKELEAIMRKDRNKKQYFRNQDNHSDTVSYSTDAFAASASADATMATWGGSTVDNLGSITEDEDGNDPEAGQEDDDGYPSDGIVQVEEEEEENDSDGTYTIEDDARQRRSERSHRSKQQSARPKLTKASVIAAGGGHGCPRPMRKQEESVRPKQATRVQKKKSKLGKRDVRVKQENYRSAEEIVQEEEQSGQSLGMLQQQLERTSQMCQALLLDQQSASPSQGMMSPSGFSVPMRGGNLMPDMLQQQIQQQQLMLCLNQCYQQLGVQQVEMQNIQQQLQGLTLQVTDSCPQSNPPINDGQENQRPSPSQTSRLTTPMTTSFSTIPNSTASINMHSSRQTTFTLNPHFPSNFSFMRHPGGRQANYYNEERKSHSPQTDMRPSDRQSTSSETHFNNLRPVPPPRIDSYLQSEDRSYLNQQQNNYLSTGRKDKNTDASKAPRLNLQDMLNSRKVKQHATQGQSTGVFETVDGMHRYSSPNQTAGTADRLGSKYRPGLSAGISGAGFHPNVYPHGANCTWIISAPAGLVIRLTFNTFSLEAHSRCAFDSVTVYDNSTINSGSQLGRYCGSTIPPVQTSTDNVMTVVLRSDSSIAHEGFTASYTTLNASTLCGAALTGMTGVVTSPNYPNNYPHQRECEWTITVPSGNQILLNFTDFAMEYHPNCNFDYVEIRNGGYSTSPLSGRYCGSSTPPSIVSHSNQMYIKFKSDVSFSARGFMISYDGTATGCGADLTTPTGSFISPNYPMPYGHNAECFWTVTTSLGSTITLTFTDFDIESHTTCGFDYVLVRDGDSGGNQLARLCGNTIPSPVVSTNNTIWIKYRTDFSVAGRGFQAVYASTCNNRLTAFSGVIESPNFPNPYPHRRNCTWIIDTTLGNTINVSFSNFDIESHSSCNYDYLQIRDGDSPSDDPIGTYCGSSLPPMFASSGSSLWINFLSDSSVARNGFRLQWMTDGCGGDLTGTSGTFSSPNFPNAYPHRRQCDWRISVPTGSAVQLTISPFDLESHSQCRFDVLEVYGGPDESANRLTQLCHTQTTPQILTSTGNTMFVRFKSDSSVSGTGFNATFTAIPGGCGGFFSSRTGTIFSKNYPNAYPHNTDCQWLIQLEENRPVELTFVDFDVEGSSTCSFDYVTVNDGDNDNSTELLKHCGNALPTPVTYRSSNNQMYVRMRTDFSVSGRGFKANYVSACGGVRNAETDGVLTSSNYPSSYDRNSNCTWLIQADHNSDRVTLTFTHMDVESRGSCSRDYVKVLDGNDANSPELGTYCGNAVPSPIQSQGSAMFVIFMSDASIQGTGFRATYTKSSSSCGGMYTAQSGSFTSPGYPNSYPGNTECVWTVQAPPGNSLMVSFSQFALVRSSNCFSDYLEMRTGGASGALIGRFCGNSLPSNMTAANSIWIKFRSDGSGTSTGFLAQYNSVFGGTITGLSGQIASPGYPGQYPHRVDYAWTITTTVGMRIRVNFVFIDIEVSFGGNCYYDYIRLRDGALATSPVLGRFCSSSLPSSVLTTSNQLRAEFHTDFSSSGRGFLFNWTATNENPTAGTTPGPTGAPGCGGNLVAMDTIQSFASPGFPSSYTNRLNCIWRITSPVGTRVAVNITSINLESHSSCNYDSVRVYDNPSASGTLLGRFCGRTPNSDILYSSSNRITIQFRTDSSVTRTGFSMTYQTACGGVFVATTGMIQSPNYPSPYPANANCSWTVSVLNGRTISVNFNQTFNIPSTAACDTDYVMLLNGRSATAPPLGNGTNRGNQLGHYCGATRPAALQTSSNRLFVNFVSDSSGSASGFRLIFSEVAVTCGGSITLTNAVRNGYITSPNYPAPYPHNVDCSWIITVPANERVMLHFEDQFNIENNPSCRYDYIEVRDGGAVTSPLLQRVCGTTLPSTQVSTGNVMFARFRTDNSVTRVGFKARYEIATCGGRINGANGTITSPNYPQNYDANLDCEWYIFAPDGHYMTFTFTSFNLQSSTNCASDSLVIREVNETGNVLFNNCGSRTVSPIDTSDSFAYVRFKTDSTIAAQGFSIFFQASVEVCGGDLVTPSGVITSPNYPGLYAHNRVCEWRIQVPAGRKVTLTFTDFRLEASRTCSWDYIEAYNGILSNSPRIGRYCGDTQPGIIESSGNYMRIKFRTDGSVTNGGFSASYTSDTEADCGGIINGAGNITSPGYFENGNYTNNLECLWTVNNPVNVNSSIKVIVRDLELERHVQCRFDFINIREGTGQNAPLLTQFCGNNTIPRPFVSPVPSLWLRFKTDFSIVGRGFWLDLETTSCGGVLTQRSGTITSPNYPATYNHGDACAWQILAPEGTRIRVRFVSVNLESSPTCQYDYLQVFNGGYGDSPLIGTYCTSTPPDFLSQSNSVRLVFLTDAAVGGGGFKVTYSFETNGCGGLFHSNQGTLMSPNYPNAYPHNTQCEWDINVDSGYTVQMTFQSFDLEAGTRCPYDYVQMSDVLTNGTLISGQRWCSTTVPDQFTSMTNRMKVKFRSDFSARGDGFAANWTTSCGGTFFGDTGMFTSPGYPSTYPNNILCNYTIVGDPGKYLSLTFDSSLFRLEGPISCRYDSVTVYSGNDTSGNRLGRFCGTTAPQTISALGGMYLQFVTDGSIVYEGFKVNYVAEECGGIFNNAYGTFSTLAHPNNYLNNHNCTWIINVAANRVVELKFTRFELEAHSRCRFDYVEVRDGNSSSSPLIGRYCGTTSPNFIRSTGRQMFVNFITDSSVTRDGFSAAYRQTFGVQQGCGGFLNNTAGGTVTSVDIDNNGQYENDLNCAWTIMMPDNKLATFNITRMDIETDSACSYDVLKIYDGSSIQDLLIGTYCGSTPPPIIKGLSNALYVTFTTDSSITRPGFTATYGQENALCGGALTATNSPQTIMSPNYPNSAGQAVRCRWVIDSSSSNQQVRLQLNGISLVQDSSCSQEYIEFRDVPVAPSGRNVHYCGSAVPATFDSAGQVVQVNYVIPDGSRSRGFSLTYQIASCDRNVTGSSGRIVSPGWPGNYPRNVNCDIQLTTPPGTTIALYFTSMNIEYHQRCVFDYLELHNGTSLSDPQVSRLCGQVTPDPVFINGNQVYMNFKTDSSVNHRGYDISYTSTTEGLGCGGNITGINGSLTSPQFPGNFSDVKTCRWLIQVPSRRTLTLTFATLSVQGEARCTENYVAVYDGDSDGTQIFGRYCNTVPAPLTASGTTAYVKFVSTGSAPAPTFRLLFSS